MEGLLRPSIEEEMKDMTTVEAMKNLGYAFGAELTSETIGDLIDELAQHIGAEPNADITATSGDVLGKTYADLVDGTATVTKAGEVEATLKYVTGFTGFSATPELQEGHYFPFTLVSTITGTTIKLVKNDGEDVKEGAFDANIVARVEPDDELKVYVDDAFVARLHFGEDVTFAEPVEG